MIHFTHARRLEKNEVAPVAHRAKHMTEYLTALQDASQKPVLECYHKLCEVTHPASPSTFLYTERDGHGSYRIGSISDATLIDAFCTVHSDLMGPVVVLGIAPAVYQLRVVEDFHIAGLRGPDLSALEINGPVWDHISARLSDPAPPETKDAEARS